MLVLSRRRMEQIVIGNDIRLTVLKIDGGQVRLGIDAPQDVMVLRAELVKPEEAEIEGPGQPAPLVQSGRGQN